MGGRRTYIRVVDGDWHAIDGELDRGFNQLAIPGFGRAAFVDVDEDADSAAAAKPILFGRATIPPGTDKNLYGRWVGGWVGG